MNRLLPMRVVGIFLLFGTSLAFAQAVQVDPSLKVKTFRVIVSPDSENPLYAKDFIKLVEIMSGKDRADYYKKHQFLIVNEKNEEEFYPASIECARGSLPEKKSLVLYQNGRVYREFDFYTLGKCKNAESWIRDNRNQKVQSPIKLTLFRGDDDEYYVKNMTVEAPDVLKGVLPESASVSSVSAKGRTDEVSPPKTPLDFKVNSGIYIHKNNKGISAK